MTHVARPARLVLAVIAMSVGLSGAPGANASAPLRATYVSIDCTGPAMVTPPYMSFGCDGAVKLSKLVWTAWTTTNYSNRARGHGDLTANNCKANCAVGRPHTYAVAIALSTPKTCPNGTHEFQTAMVSFHNRKPAWAHWKQEFRQLGCSKRYNYVSLGPPNTG